MAQLSSTASYQARDLRGVNISGNDLTRWNLTGQNLTNATIAGATLYETDLTGAQVQGVNFGRSYLTFQQLSSTASYQAHDLTGIGMFDNYLTGWNLTGQNLTNASFDFATLTGADLTGAEVRGARLYGSTFFGFTATQLYSTGSYRAHDLTGIDLSGNNLAGWNLAGQNLTNVSFESTTLSGADITGAEIRGALFGGTTARGFTSTQLYSTASYQAHDLTGINFSGNNLTGWYLAGQNLTNSFFSSATLTGADLTGADARRALFLNLTSAIVTNLIRPDGKLNGLDLGLGKSLVVRDYDGDPTQNLGPLPIRVEQHFAMDAAGTLQMVFEADAWDSTISFASGIPIAIGGSLELTFAADVNVSSQIGRTFDLFDWTGVNPIGVFIVVQPVRLEPVELIHHRRSHHYRCARAIVPLADHFWSARIDHSSPKG